MADEGRKREDPSVLGSLPAKRPERLGRPRDENGAKRATPAAAPKRAKPAAVRPGAKQLPRPARVKRPPARAVDPPRGTELVTTAIQAAGELAQIGFTVGGRVLKRAVDRLPHP